MDAQTACPVRGSWLWVIEDQKEKGSFPVCRTLSTWPPLFHKSANFPSRGEYPSSGILGIYSFILSDL